MFTPIAPHRGGVYVSRTGKAQGSFKSQSPAVPFIYGRHTSTLFSTLSDVAIVIFLFLVTALSWRLLQ